MCISACGIHRMLSAFFISPRLTPRATPTPRSSVKSQPNSRPPSPCSGKLGPKLKSSRNSSRPASWISISNFSSFRNLIRFHDSIFEVANVSEIPVRDVRKVPYLSKNSKFDFIIVGSGPGGAISARELQKAGFSTCILEGGQIIDDGIAPFSYNEMINQYKHAGITTTLGNENITYVEGATFGGGSEINSGFYHRTPKDII